MNQNINKLLKSGLARGSRRTTRHAVTALQVRHRFKSGNSVGLQVRPLGIRARPKAGIRHRYFLLLQSFAMLNVTQVLLFTGEVVANFSSHNQSSFTGWQ